jgi:hypothetical protein
MPLTMSIAARDSIQAGMICSCPSIGHDEKNTLPNNCPIKRPMTELNQNRIACLNEVPSKR